MNIKRVIIPVFICAVIIGACTKDKPNGVTEPEAALQFFDSIYPADGDVNVPLGSSIKVFFLRPMDTLTVIGRKFILSPSHTYSFSGNQMQATLSPAGDLLQCAEYKMTIDSGLADQEGNVMLQPYTYHFRTVSGSSFIDSITPLNGKIDVSLKASVTATFSMDMNPSTIDTSTVFLSDGARGTVTYQNRVIRFQPSDSLAPLHTYTVTLKGSIASAEGVTLGKDFTWTFTTVDVSWPSIVADYPVNGSEGAALNTAIWLEFSKRLDNSSVSADEFVISGNPQGHISVLEKRVRYILEENLQPDSLYTATFDGTVKDLAGHEFYFNHSWSFRTMDILTAEIVRVIPADGYQFVYPTSNISVEFTRDIAIGCVSTDEFTVTGGASVSGTININGRIVTFNPQYDLSPGAYTAVFDGDVIDTGGDTLQIHYSWTFAVPPFDVLEWSPDGGCTPPDTVIKLQFGLPVNPATVIDANIVVKELSGTPVSGSLECHDSVVVFRPAQPFEILTEYTVDVSQNVRSILGGSLLHTLSFGFTTHGENLLPLAIGNKWIYNVTTSGYCTPPESHVDSIFIVRDSLINGVHYFVDQNRYLYRYEDEIIETSLLLIYFIQSHPFLFDNNGCENGTLATSEFDSEPVICQHFTAHIEPWGTPDYYDYGYNFAPDIGMVYVNRHSHEGRSVADTYQTWQLISYELH